MISLRTLSLSAAFAAVLPLQALAAFSSPGALVLAWMDDRSARDFAVEAHAQVEEYYFSLWAKGAYKGMWPQDGIATESITFDMAAPAEGMKARVKVDVILKDNVVYAKLVSAEGTVDQAMTELSASLKMKEWVALPLDEGMMAALEEGGMGMEDQKMIISAIYDAMFTMNAVPKSWGTEYQLFLKRDFLSQMMNAMVVSSPDLGMVMGMSDKDELRDIERMILRHLTLDVKLNVDTKDLSLGTTVNGTFDMPEENVKIRFSADTSRRKTPLVVNAPATSVSLEAFLESLDGADFSGMDDFMPPMLDPLGGFDPNFGSDYEPDASDEEWTDDTWTDEDSSGSSCPLSDMRKGLCGERPLRNR